MMGQTIKEKDYTKYLRILIDKNRSWSPHIKHVNLNIFNGVAILYKLRHYVSKNTLKMLYHAFIQPHIDYGLIVWESATKSNLKIIQEKMKKAIITISFKKSNHQTEPLSQELQILNSEENQKNLQTTCFMWKLSNNETPASISENFQIRNRTFGEKNFKYHVPSAKSDLLTKNIIFQGPRLWNSLKTELKNKKRLATFKNTFQRTLRDHK